MKLWKKPAPEGPDLDEIIPERREEWEGIILSRVRWGWERLPDFDPEPQCPLCCSTLSEPRAGLALDRDFDACEYPSLRTFKLAAEGWKSVSYAVGLQWSRREVSMPVLRWQCNNCGCAAWTKAAVERLPNHVGEQGGVLHA